MNNYIEFYKEEGKLIACIYDFDYDKKRVVKNNKNLKKLKAICEDYGYDTTKPCIIDDDLDTINNIIDDFNYFIEQQKHHNKTSIFRQAPENSKLVKKPPLKHKKVIIGALTAAIVITGIVGYEKSKNNKEKEEKIDDSISTQVTDSSNDYFQNEEIEIESIINEDNFHFSYEDRSTDTPIENTKQYESLFETYAYRYGLDKNFDIAVWEQEKKYIAIEG